jgi:hypothetical protein
MLPDYIPPWMHFLLTLALAGGVSFGVALLAALARDAIHRFFPPRIVPHVDPIIEAKIARLEAETESRGLFAAPLALAGMVALAMLTWRLGHAILDRVAGGEDAIVLWCGVEPILIFHGLAGLALAVPFYNAWYILRHGREHARLVQIADARYDERAGGGFGRLLHRHGRWLFTVLVVAPLIVWGDLYTVVSSRDVDAAVRGAFLERRRMSHAGIDRILAVRRLNRLGEHNRPIHYIVYFDGTVLSDDTSIDVLADLGVSWSRERMKAAIELLESGHVGEVQSVDLPVGGEVPGVTDVRQGVRRP